MYYRGCLFLLAVICVQGEGFRFGRKRLAPESEYATRSSCMNVNFDMKSHLRAMEDNEDRKIQLLANGKLDLLTKGPKDPKWAFALFGSGHSWVNVGHRCLDHPGAYDCQPFSNVTEKLNDLRTCLTKKLDVSAAGRWLNRPSQVENFEFYQVKPIDRIVYRLAILANKESSEWLTEAQLLSIFSPEQLPSLSDTLDTCLEDAIVERDDLKCWPVLMGAPGFTGLTLLDHEGDIRSPPKITDTFNVNPVCARVAIEELTHFQAVYFDKNLFNGYQRTRGIYWRSNWARTETGRMVHRKCQRKPSFLKPTLCWNFSECVPEMLRIACSRYVDCCPDVFIHAACVADLGSPRCSVSKL